MEPFFAQLHGLPPGTTYLAIAGILLLCGFGLPIPEDLSLITAGYLAHQGVLDVHRALAVCLGAVLGGDALAFFLGRRFGQRFLQSAIARRFFPLRRQRRVRAYFRKYGSKVVFIGRFLPGLRFSIFFSAGTLHLRAPVFFVYDSLAALLSVPLLVYSAWWFGDYIDSVVLYARRTEHGIAIAVAAVVLFVVVRMLRRRGRLSRRKAAKPGEPTSSS